MGKVAGTVKYDGKALPTGSIIFSMGTKGHGTGPIDASGHYALSMPMPPGSYKVAVRAEEVSSQPPPPGKMPEVKSLIPQKYGDINKSGLTATIKQGANELDFDLKP